MNVKKELSFEAMKRKLQRRLTTNPVQHSRTNDYEWIINVSNSQDYNYISDVYPLVGTQLWFRAKLSAEGVDRATWSIKFEDPINTKRHHTLKSFPKITFTILDQSDGEKTRDLVRTYQPEFNQTLVYNDWQLFHSILHFNLNPQRRMYNFYCKNECLHVRISTEAVEDARSSVSNDGILLWRLDNYAEVRQKAVNGYVWSQESPCFYTSPEGYRVSVRVRLAKGVLTNVCFLTGEHDHLLTQQFPHRLTLTVFNPADPSKHLVTHVDKLTADSYCLNFPNHPDLMERGLVNDDSVMFKVVIKPHAIH